MTTKLKAKLTTAKEQVREAYVNGATLREIADVHGVSPGTVRNTLIEMGVDLRRRGRRHKGDVPEPKTLPVADLSADPTPEVS